MSISETGYGNGKARIKEHMDTVRDDISGLGADVKTLASTVTSQARDGLSEASDRAQSIAKDAFEQLQTQVRTKPGVALGVAAGVGILVGLMLSSRR